MVNELRHSDNRLQLKVLPQSLHAASPAFFFIVESVELTPTDTKPKFSPDPQLLVTNPKSNRTPEGHIVHARRQHPTVVVGSSSTGQRNIPNTLCSTFLSANTEIIIVCSVQRVRCLASTYSRLRSPRTLQKELEISLPRFDETTA